jgi:hypothetical protein
MESLRLVNHNPLKIRNLQRRAIAQGYLEAVEARGASASQGSNEPGGEGPKCAGGGIP